jgi:hypothetical protein
MNHQQQKNNPIAEPKRGEGEGLPPSSTDAGWRCGLSACIAEEEKVTISLVEGSPGPALVAGIRAEIASQGLEPDGREEELLAIASGLADRLAELETAIIADGLTSVLKTGVVLHPAVSESRQTRAASARVLAGVQMEDSSKDPVKQQAAQSRWRSHNEAKKRAGSF